MLSFLRRFRRPLFAVPAGLILLVASGLAADWWVGIPEESAARYVGGDSCIACHQNEHQKWHGSHHDLAMQMATQETVLGDFADVEFDYRGTVSKLFQEGDKFFVTTDGKEGEMETFPIKYTFGVTPLQQYMVEFEDGRVQVIPFCWDTKNKRWFHIYEEDPHTLTPEDPTHWTNVGQNWNHTCAECHSTNLVKGYDIKTDTFHTTFTDINVNCESCHGPGSHHVEMAESWSPFWDRKRGYGLAKLKGLNTTPQIETCAKCHAHRDLVHPGFDAGEDFDSHYQLSLLDTGLYYHDGQILEEDYVYGSFLQSLMYRKGVRCTDCHDPHSTQLKFPGNELCAQCHVPAKYDTPGHHHHSPNSAGASCVECHMPERTYMVVDPRRDHSIRVPRPDLSVLLGTPNSCVDCHIETAFDPEKAEAVARNENLGPRTLTSAPEPSHRDYAAWMRAAESGDESAQAEIDAWNAWALEKTNEWYGEKKPSEHFALTIDAAMRGEVPPEILSAEVGPNADRRDELSFIEDRLMKLARDSNVGPIVRASAVSLFGNYPTQATLAANAKALEDNAPLVRLAALRNIETFYSMDPISVRERESLRPEERNQVDAQLSALATALAKSLHDPVRNVRMQAARIGSLVPPSFFSKDDRAAFDRALGEYRDGLMSNADQAAAWTTWAGVLERQQKLAEAEQAYLLALRQLNEFIPARLALATLYSYQERNQEAEKLLRESIDILPEIPEPHYSLGLLLAALPDRMAEAQKYLGDAARLAPNQHRMRYNNGLALQRLGQWPAAEAELNAAANLSPDSVDYKVALMSFYEARSQWAKALAVAQSLAPLMPGNPQLQAKISELQQKAASGAFGPIRN